MTDELTAVRESCPHTSPPAAQVTLDARETLLRTAQTRPAGRRYAARFLAAAVAAAAIVVVTGVVNPWEGPSGATAAAAQILHRSAVTVGETPKPGPGEYLYIRSDITDTAVGETSSTSAGGNSQKIETWLPGNSKEVTLQRSRDASGSILISNLSNTQVPALYGDHPQGSAELLAAIRTLAVETDRANDHDRATWLEAFAILQDPLAPNELKSDILLALSTLDGVKIIEERAVVGDRIGVALGLEDAGGVQLVFDPETGDYVGAKNTNTRSVTTVSTITNDRPLLKTQPREQRRQLKDAYDSLTAR